MYCSPNSCDVGDDVYYEFQGQGVSMVTCIDYFGPWGSEGDDIDESRNRLNEVGEKGMFKEMEGIQIKIIGSCGGGEDQSQDPITVIIREHANDLSEACVKALTNATQEFEQFVLVDNWDDFKALTKKTFKTLAKIAITSKVSLFGTFASKLFKQLLNAALDKIIDLVLEEAKQTIQDYEDKDDMIQKVCAITNFKDKADQAVNLSTSSSPAIAVDNSTSSSGWCFSGSSEVQMESGDTKKFHELKISDRILTADVSGKQSFSPVVFLPHKTNTIKAEFLQVVTKSGKTLRATMAHMIQACDGSLVLASTITPNQCIRTIDGSDEVASVQKVVSLGVYTAITLGGDYLIVDGVVASPFASHKVLPTALTHRFAHGFYNIHRVLYMAMPSSWAVESRPVALFTEMTRAFAFAAVSKYRSMYNMVIEALPVRSGFGVSASEAFLEKICCKKYDWCFIDTVY